MKLKLKFLEDFFFCNFIGADHYIIIYRLLLVEKSKKGSKLKEF